MHRFLTGGLIGRLSYLFSVELLYQGGLDLRERYSALPLHLILKITVVYAHSARYNTGRSGGAREWLCTLSKPGVA